MNTGAEGRQRRRPLPPPGVLLNPVVAVAYLAFAVALSAHAFAPSGATSVALFLVAFSLKVTAVTLTAWDRRSRGRVAVWWSLGVVLLDALAYLLYTVLRRRSASTERLRAPADDSFASRSIAPIWLVALGFVLVAIVVATPLAFPLLVGAVTIGCWTIARRRRSVGAALLAAAIAVPALVAGYTVGNIKPYRIPSSSMAPTFAIGDRVLATLNGAYHPHRGEIVVFHPPAGALDFPSCGLPVAPRALCPLPTPQVATTIAFVKRVVAVPGDRVAFRHGRLVLNGKVQSEPFTTPCGSGPGCSYRPSITIPKGDYFMLGDNRGASDDSRFFGPVPSSSILGPVVLIYWPTRRVGTP